LRPHGCLERRCPIVEGFAAVSEIEIIKPPRECAREIPCMIRGVKLLSVRVLDQVCMKSGIK
jgi:hypothetical protein